MFTSTAKRRMYKKLVATFLVALLFVLAAPVFRAMVFADETVGSRVSVDGIELEGMGREEVIDVLQGHVDQLAQTPLVVQVNDETYTFFPEDLGITYDFESTFKQVFLLGSTGVDYLASLVSEYFSGQDYESAVLFDADKVEAMLRERVDIVNGAQNARLALNEGEWVVMESAHGLGADFDSLVASLEKDVRSLDRDAYRLETFPVYAEFTTDDANALLSDVQALTDVSHELTFDVGLVTQRFPFDFRSSEDWISIQRNKDGEWRASLHEAKIGQVIAEEIAPLIEREAEDVTISGTYEKDGFLFADATGLAQDGVTVDITATMDSMLGNMAEGIETTSLVAYTTPARIISQDGVELSFPDRVGVGMSNYATSSDARIHNVKFGLSKVHNRVVMPGEEFGFNSHMLPITNEAGWENELAIFGGGGLKKVPGGGLCQVSTTVYRAFFNGGFDIKERFPHSLYVSYYTAYQDGLDATIYPGYGEWRGKNMRVVNDTPNPILIQTFTNDETLDATVQIYGTSDGRVVEVEGPIYLNNKWIGTEYIEDPSLPAGYESVEANGAYGKLIQWNRKVTYSNGDVNAEEIYSRYNAKKKVVRVGTGA